MNKKDILMVVVIAAVVGVVASLVTSNVSGDVSLSPGRIIEATSCDADRFCEIVNAKIKGNLEVRDITGGNLILSGDYAANAVVINPNIEAPIQSNAYRGHIYEAYACFTAGGKLVRSDFPCNHAPPEL